MGKSCLDYSLSLAPNNASLEEKILFALMHHARNSTCVEGSNNQMTPGNVAVQLSYVLSSIAILANIGSIVAILKIRKKLNANLRLILNLSIVDTTVAICLSVEMRKVLPQLQCPHIILRCVRMSAHCLTLLNLIALALDHYYAIVKTLHYRAVMNVTRINWGIVIMWSLSLLLGFSKFYLPSGKNTSGQSSSSRNTTHSSNLSIVGNANYTKENYAIGSSACQFVLEKEYDEEHTVFALSVFAFFILFFLYLSIFVTLHQRNSLLIQHMKLMKRKRKGVFTTVLLVGTFMLCWLPYCIFSSYELIKLKQIEAGEPFDFKFVSIHFKYSFFLYDLIILNSICDPIIYAWRMREVQRSYLRIIRQLKCKVRKFRQRKAVQHVPSSNLSSNSVLRGRGVWDFFRPQRLWSQGSNDTNTSDSSRSGNLTASTNPSNSGDYSDHVFLSTSPVNIPLNSIVEEDEKCDNDHTAIHVFARESLRMSKSNNPGISTDNKSDSSDESLSEIDIFQSIASSKIRKRSSLFKSLKRGFRTRKTSAPADMRDECEQLNFSRAEANTRHHKKYGNGSLENKCSSLPRLFLHDPAHLQLQRTYSPTWNDHMGRQKTLAYPPNSKMYQLAKRFHRRSSLPVEIQFSELPKRPLQKILPSSANG